MPELSGEQKLRIVLESIIRKVPKEEQCRKYGISEQEFLGWQDQLTKNGGRIFEPGFKNNRSSQMPKNRPGMSPVTKAILTVSLLFNVGLVTVASVLYWKENDKPLEDQAVVDTIASLDSPLHSSQPDTDFLTLSL